MLRGADDAHVDAHHLVAPERHHLTILDHVEQTRLQRHRHVADLIKEQRATVRLQDPAHAAFAGGTGESARLVTEQLAFDQSLRNGSTVHRDEGLIRAVAGVMNGARAITLAGARFTQQQHRDIAIDAPAAAPRRCAASPDPPNTGSRASRASRRRAPRRQPSAPTATWVRRVDCTGACTVANQRSLRDTSRLSASAR